MVRRSAEGGGFEPYHTSVFFPSLRGLGPVCQGGVLSSPCIPAFKGFGRGFHPRVYPSFVDGCELGRTISGDSSPLNKDQAEIQGPGPGWLVLELYLPVE
jgi:hypothetical protein